MRRTTTQTHPHQQQVHEKEETIGEYIREKEELSLQIEMLQHKLDEREQLSKEMILAMKDIETRFAHFNHATAEATVVNGNGEMQQVKLSFSYRFGSSQVKAAQQRKSAIDEEKKRAEAGGQQGGIGQ